jgi:hypothetical protein
MNHSQRAIDRIFGSVKTRDRSKSKSKSAGDTPVYNLKISEEKKYADDCQWFKDYMDYIVPPYSSTIENYKEMKLAYDLLNDNLEGYKSELNKFCNKFGENFGQIEEDIMPYPKLHNNVNVLKGEYLNRPDSYKVVLLSARAIRDKNRQLLERVKQSVDEAIFLRIKRMEAEMAQMNPQQVEQYIEELRTQETPEDLLAKNFQSEWEIFYSKAVKYGKYDQMTKRKRGETLQDVLTADRCFIYSGWKFGKPSIEVRNPLYVGFEKDPNEFFINKADYVWYKKPISIADVYNNYGEFLSDEEIESLGIHTNANNNRVDKRHALGGTYVHDHTNQDLFKDLVHAGERSFEDKNVGLSQGQGIYRRDARQHLVWETHFEFKAYKRLIFLTYLDEYNKKITLPLLSTFDIPEGAEKVKYTNRWGQQTVKYVWTDPYTESEMSAEEVWIPRKYEAVRLGTDVYPICREVPNQRLNLQDPFGSFNLSTFGAVFTSRNSRSISPVTRAIPAYFQYLFIKHIQNRELSKYQGFIQDVDVDQIPNKLGKDIDGNVIRDPIATWFLWRKAAGVSFYSGSQTTTGGLPPATRSPGSTGHIIGTAQDIYVMQQILDMLEVEIGMAMGISPQRVSQFKQHSNVSDNQEAILRSHNITEPYFYYLDLIWKEVMEDYVNNFKEYCYILKEQAGEMPLFQFMLPDGVEELLEVTPKMLEAIDIGLFVQDGGREDQYQQMMLSYAQAFAQNAGEGVEVISSLIKAITSGASAEEVHKMVKMASNEQQQRMQQMEQTRLKVQQEYLARQKEAIEDQQSHEIEKIDRKGEWDLKKAEVSAMGFDTDKDRNDNAVPDVLEVEKLRHQIDVDNRKLDLEEKKLNIEKQKAKADAKKKASNNN